MNLGLSDAYKIINEFVKKNQLSLSIADLHERILASDNDLSEESQKLKARVSSALKCLAKKDEEQLIENLMYMRIHAMRMSTLFDDFVDVLDEATKDL